MQCSRANCNDERIKHCETHFIASVCKCGYTSSIRETTTTHARDKCVAGVGHILQLDFLSSDFSLVGSALSLPHQAPSFSDVYNGCAMAIAVYFLFISATQLCVLYCAVDCAFYLLPTYVRYIFCCLSIFFSTRIALAKGYIVFKYISAT